MNQTSKKSRFPRLRFPVSQEEYRLAYRAWDRRNGRYYIAADVVLDKESEQIVFDSDSGIAMEAQKAPLTPRHFGAYIRDMKITIINSRQVNSPHQVR